MCLHALEKYVIAPINILLLEGNDIMQKRESIIIKFHNAIIYGWLTTLNFNGEKIVASGTRP